MKHIIYVEDFSRTCSLSLALARSFSSFPIFLLSLFSFVAHAIFTWLIDPARVKYICLSHYSSFFPVLAISFDTANCGKTFYPCRWMLSVQKQYGIELESTACVRFVSEINGDAMRLVSTLDEWWITVFNHLLLHFVHWDLICFQSIYIYRWNGQLHFEKNKFTSNSVKNQRFNSIQFNWV